MRKMWSKNQLKNEISGASAEVVEALNGQDVKVKTLEQSEASWSGVFEGDLPKATFTGFKGIKIINNIFWIIISGKYTADDDYEQQTSLALYISNIPLEYKEKIYSINGNKISDLNDYENVAQTNIIVGTSRDRGSLIGSNARFVLTLYGMSPLTAGGEIAVDCRIPLLLL